MTTQLEDRNAQATYEQMAPYYDAFTAHHDYELWLGELLPVAQAAGLSGSCALDVACGTGKSFMPLVRRGWKVTACDVSNEMLALARGQAPSDVELFVADMRELPTLSDFSLILCLGDAVNYLTESGDLEACFAGFRRNIASDGLVVFDLNTLTMYRTFFATRDRKTIPGHQLVWEGLASPTTGPGDFAEARFEVYTADESEPRISALHRQRHHPIDEIQGCLASAGLSCVAVYGHGYDAKLERPLDEARHTKAIVIARPDHPQRERR